MYAASSVARTQLAAQLSTATAAVTHATAAGKTAGRAAAGTAIDAIRTSEPRRTAGRFRMISNYRYPFPTIPRPKRNLFYYNPVSTLTRGLRSIPVRTKVGSYFKVNGETARLVPRSVRRGYGTLRRYSTSQGASGGATAGGAGGAGPGGFRRISWQWLAVPAVTVVIWTVLRRRRHDKQSQEDTEAQIPRPAKPWQVAAYSTLPLKAVSRLWGRLNDIELPVWMREPGFKFYSYLFGVNLDEVAEPDLATYRNLGEFFYRKLKPGVRPIADTALVSPADGKVLHLGVINDGVVEQVKGVTYSLDALLGGSGDDNEHRVLAVPSRMVDFDHHDESEIMERHKEFAVVNGISYTLDELIGHGEGDHNQAHQNSGAESPQNVEDQGDATYFEKKPSPGASTKVTSELLRPSMASDSEKELFFAVIYLAPGDYHRFHSPANWVSELRRHFVGELYSVAPYFQTRLAGLFCLNERVALLGRWRHGFFSMTPVGATNVGSILINFDKDLRTNTVYETATAAQETESVASRRRKRVKKATCYEANYAKASKLLGGYPLLKGEEMGGFNLGSTVVLVFEAPKSFKFNVKAGEKVKVGQALGDIA